MSESRNECSVTWEYWVGDPEQTGFCYLPCSHPALHVTHPWIVADVSTQRGIAAVYGVSIRIALLMASAANGSMRWDQSTR